MNRRLKQFIYGSVYLTIFLGLISWVYFSAFHTLPSCADGIQNQDEGGIDCGGSCSKVCLPVGSLAIEVVDHVRALRLDDDHLSLLVRIQNTNLDFAAKNFSYTFNLYNLSDEIIARVSGSSPIYAGEIRYLTAPNLNFSPASIGKVTLDIVDPEWVAPPDFPKPDLAVQNHKTYISENQIKVEGTLTNQGLNLIPGAKVIAVFYGEFNLPVGVSQTELENLAASETRSFSINHPPLGSVIPSSTQVFIFGNR